MDKEERSKAAGEPAWYASAARPSTPGELTKVPPAELAGTEPAALAAAESEESADARKNKAKLRRLAGLFAALAAFYLLLGEEWIAMFTAVCALSNALEGETRWRVPTFVKVCVGVLMAIFGILIFVQLILKGGGR